MPGGGPTPGAAASYQHTDRKVQRYCLQVPGGGPIPGGPLLPGKPPKEGGRPYDGAPNILRQYMRRVMCTKENRVSIAASCLVPTLIIIHLSNLNFGLLRRSQR